MPNTLLKINVSRIEYMMNLFDLSKEALLSKISEKTKGDIVESQIFRGEIKKSNLKKIDEIFNKGLSFYTDPSDPDQTPGASIFFRKSHFNAKLSLGDREIIHKMEQRIHYLSSINILADFNAEPLLPPCKLKNDPVQVALNVRKEVLPVRGSQKLSDRDFLKIFIEKLASKNILVFEFVEVWNKKNKANIEGFFVAPNYIVLKRNQKALKREIFTLAHELGHYLLNNEQIDANIWNASGADEIERWCNQFAFSLIAYQLPDFTNISIGSDEIKKFSKEKHISRLAIFYNLAADHVISWNKYKQLKKELNDEYEAKEKEAKIQRAQTQTRSRGSTPKPIISPLEKDMVVHAYFEGAMEEYDVLTHFNIKEIEKIVA